MGPSGAGKSTWMMTSLCYLKKTYQCHWLYLDHKMEISQSQYMPIYEYFQMYLINKNIARLELEEKIISYSVLLGLEKVINAKKYINLFKIPQEEKLREFVS